MALLLAFFGALYGTVSFVSEPALAWANRLPELSRTVERKLWPVKKTIEQATEASRDLERMAAGAGAQPCGATQPRVE